MSAAPRQASSHAIQATPDKRFKRAHVKPGRKRSSAARTAWLIVRTLLSVTVLGYAAYRGASLVVAAPALQISQMVVRGHQRLSDGEVLALVDGLRGQHILSADLDRWQERLRSSPWVEGATIRRVLPSTLEISVRERQPMGIARLGAAAYLIDGKGVIVDEYGPAYADLDLPIIDGLGAAPRDGGTMVDELRAEFAGRVIAGLSTRPELLNRVSQIDVSNLHDAVVILHGDPALLRLGERAFADRLQQYLDLAPALGERLDAIDYVDLRFDQRLYVRPVKQGKQVKQVAK
jgi:cell division protein FtsQ